MVHQQHLIQVALLWTLFWNNGQDADKSQKRKFLIPDLNYNLLIHDYFSSPHSQQKLILKENYQLPVFCLNRVCCFTFVQLHVYLFIFFGHNLTTSHIFLRSCQSFFGYLEKYMEHAWNIFENLITQIKLKNLLKRDLSCVSQVRGWQVYHVNENVKMEINRLYIFA